jgi:hypothetical protein
MDIHKDALGIRIQDLDAQKGLDATSLARLGIQDRESLSYGLMQNSNYHNSSAFAMGARSSSESDFLLPQSIGFRCQYRMKL